MFDSLKSSISKSIIDQFQYKLQFPKFSVRLEIFTVTTIIYNHSYLHPVIG